MQHREKYTSLGYHHQCLYQPDYVPSRVPDWRQYESYNGFIPETSQPMEMYCAEYPPQQALVNSTDLLEIHGVALGVLRSVSNAPSPGSLPPPLFGGPPLQSGAPSRPPRD